MSFDISSANYKRNGFSFRILRAYRLTAVQQVFKTKSVFYVISSSEKNNSLVQCSNLNRTPCLNEVNTIKVCYQRMCIYIYIYVIGIIDFVRVFYQKQKKKRFSRAASGYTLN